MNQEELEQLLEKCLVELNVAYQGECEPERAEKNAALFLQIQLRLSSYLANAELKAKMAKNEVERLSSQKYFEYKTGALGAEKKLTEAALEHAISKDEEIFKMKEEMIKNEAEYKKWNFILNVLSNGHIFYRNLGKREFGI
jgi:hypothetical protein